MGDGERVSHAEETSSESRPIFGLFPKKPAFTATGIFGLAGTVFSSAAHDRWFVYAGIAIAVISVIGYVTATAIAAAALALAAIIGPIVVLAVIAQLSLGSMDQKPSFLAAKNLTVPVGACVVPAGFGPSPALDLKATWIPPQSGQDPTALSYFFDPPENLDSARLKAAENGAPVALSSISTASECGQVARRRLEDIAWVILIPLAIFGASAVIVLIAVRYLLPAPAGAPGGRRGGSRARR